MTPKLWNRGCSPGYIADSHAKWKLEVSCCFLLLFSLVISAAAHASQPDAQPVNSDATPAARALLKELDGISGRAILSGEHNYPNTVSQYSNRVYELTGKYPAIFGQDFGFAAGEDKDSTLSRPHMIREVIRQYRAGAIPALCWHAVPPTQEEPVTFQGSILSKLTDWEFQQLLTPGTDLHTRWERQVDRIAGYLRELQDAGVPVLFRPYHEMNGNWFWWGGRPGPNGTSALYKMIFDRFVHVHHLNNLIWVWNVAAASSKSQPPDQYWPGPQYVDIVSMDIYRPYKQTDYESMVALAGDRKPTALAEVGTIPSLQVLAQQPRWTYFMIWSEFAEDHNTPETLKATLSAPNVISRGDARLPVPFPAPATPVSPQDVKATAEAGSLLSSLSSPEQEKGSAGPAIREINSSSVHRKDLTEELQRCEDAKQVPLLRWTPASPTDEGSAPFDAYTWSQLRTPGTPLHKRWIEEIDELGRTLRETRGAILLSILPDADRDVWWSRPGLGGSEALFREAQGQLEELGVHNVLWAWEPAIPAMNHPSPAEVLASYFPGPLAVDVYILDLEGSGEQREATLAAIKAMAAESPLGLRDAGNAEQSASTVTMVRDTSPF